jgi:hypothetical protein
MPFTQVVILLRSSNWVGLDGPATPGRGRTLAAAVSEVAHFCSRLTHEAARSLGRSYSTLYRWRTCGLLKRGFHWRRKFPNTKSPILYNLSRVEASMSETTASGLDAIEPALALPSF